MQSSPTAEMLHLISGFQVSRALFVAATLGLADLVCEGEKTCSELASITHTNKVALHRVIRVLASAGVFGLLPDERVVMTELTPTLLTDAPGSLRAWAIGQLGGEHYQAWGELMHSVHTGDVAFEHLFGMSPWAYRAQHPQSAQEFDNGMSSFIGAHHQAVLAAYPFCNLATVYDIGGGDGQFLEAALSTFPAMRGLLLELPHVAVKARLRLVQAGLAERCQVVDGNIFESMPVGGAAYVMSRIIHDWNDDQAQQILAVCCKAMGPDSVLLLVERLMPEAVDCTASTRVSVVSDLNMLVMTGGRERTEAQYRALLNSASFEMTSVVATDTALSVIEARPK
jgi:O-methyltransferase domain